MSVDEQVLVDDAQTADGKGMGKLGAEDSFRGLEKKKQDRIMSRPFNAN